ncbi:MAG: Dual-specificity RNA methyltransferase RlmN [Chlamydiia bacterium]|nr:Dual-specificity RNA methyltransferase RlmN [Chlamydiia bacterium]
MSASIYTYTSSAFASMIQEKLGKGRELALRAYRIYYREQRVISCDEVEEKQRPLLSKILDELNISPPSEVSSAGEDPNCAQAEKVLFTHADGLETESVVIPMKFGNTLCVSSQVGCKKGCAFCETGRMGLIRDLSVEEIVYQVFAMRAMGIEISNLVFMGMGEPFDNYENVVAAIGVLVDSNGLSVAPRRITVSTSGVVDKIYAFCRDVPRTVRLAISINAPNDQVRMKVMPVTRQWGMGEIKEALSAYQEMTGQEVLIEYVLLKGVTDRLEDAQELAEYLRGLDVKVNLIPYNPQSRPRFEAPEREQVGAFSRFMQEAGYLTFVRESRGEKKMAACGQLGNLELRRRILKEKKAASDMIAADMT